MDLTPKQKAFADEYIKNGGNASDAAIKAGYAKKNARVIGNQNLTKLNISEYIAEKQSLIEKQKGTDIMSLAEIQQRRSMIARGELTDSFGFAPDFSDQLKSMNDLEKALKIKQEQEEKKAAEEAARNAKEYHMDLYNIPDCFHWAIRDIRDKKHLEYVFKGGRGSTKSTTVGMTIVELMRNNHDIHAVVCRKVGNTIKDSVYNKIKWAIGKQEFKEEFDSKLSPMEITLKSTGQKIYFRGADDPDKIKSINPEFGYIGILWFEELDQFSGPEEIRKIEQSAIRGGDLAWIFKSFNPPKTMNNWANKYVLEPKENRIVHSSTYLDVPSGWLGQPFIDEAEHLKEVNPNAYEHEYMGIANGNGGNVFEYLEIRDITDEEISHMDRIFAGVDFGWYPDQFCYLRTYYDSAREKIYLIDELYVNKWSNSKTAEWIKKKGYDDYTMICDSAEPKSVNDFRDAGLPARGAIKGPGSIEYGFKFLQTKTIVIDPKRTPNAYKEITEYEYDRDKEGNVISGYPDGNDHAISALRYAYEPLFNRRGNSA
jgi:PBSX family phage terminase large subunit|nr:MAG TPA_asm: terminase large subunit [Caudoviricetes sp.]